MASSTSTTAQAEQAQPQADIEAVKAEIIKGRNDGMTLAELKAAYPQFTGDQIRSVLPPANARERKAREAKQPKADQPKQPQANGKAEAKGTKQPQAKAEAEPKAKTEAPKLVETPADLRAALVEARESGLSRNVLVAELVKIDPATDGHNVVWKAEFGGKDKMGEIVPAYLPALRKLLDAVKSGDIKAPERKTAGAGPAGGPTKAELAAKLDAAANLLFAEWHAVKPAAFRDKLAEIIDVRKPTEEVKS